MNIETLKLQIEAFRQIGLDTSDLQEQLEKLGSIVETSENAQDEKIIETQTEVNKQIESPVMVALTIPEIAAQETQSPEMHTQNDEHKKNESIQEVEQEQVSQPIAAVATTATDTPSEEVAFILACAYRWLVSINMSDRKRVMFQSPPAFEFLTTMGMIANIPAEAEWTCWSRLHGEALDKFFSESALNADAFQKMRAGVMNQSSTLWKKHSKRIKMLSGENNKTNSKKWV